MSLTFHARFHRFIAFAHNRIDDSIIVLGINQPGQAVLSAEFRTCAAMVLGNAYREVCGTPMYGVPADRLS